MRKRLFVCGIKPFSTLGVHQKLAPLKQLLLPVTLLFSLGVTAQDVNDLKLKDYRPVSIYKTPQANIAKAKYPAYDMHTHDYVDDARGVDEWVKTMDEMNIAKSMINTYTTGKEFDSIVDKYSKHKDRFIIFCGFDYTGADQPGWSDKAIKELERCVKAGARGVGELGDKGLGELYSKPTPGRGIHIDDPRMKPLIKRCGELKIPINIHVSEDEWMYLPADSTNDGLMNSAKWKVDMSVPGKLNHDELIQTLENAVRENPGTTFIASHLANTCSDLSQLAKLFDKYPNLYADVSARYGEIAPIPRYVHAFMEKYADRIVYGTDMSPHKPMYLTTFRILESADEHFYEHDLFGYHWPLYGLHLTDATLKKIYNSNAVKILSQKR
ncbi:MAG: amidohydrolase [Chitinophagaceae bacterium]|nr:amidohydrolase [Chitinophagaceae bacterium]